MNPDYYEQPYPSISPMMPMPHQGFGNSSIGNMDTPHMQPNMLPNMRPCMKSNTKVNENINSDFSYQMTTGPFMQAGENNAVFAELAGIPQVM